MRRSTIWIAALGVAPGCAAPSAPLPPTPMIPVSFTLDLGVALGDSPVRAPDGQALAAQTYLRMAVKNTWSTPSPEPEVQCAAVWTWNDPLPLERPAPDWATAAGAVAVARVIPSTADWSSTDCTLVDDVPVEALLGGGLALALGPNPYLRWQDALALLPPEVDVGDVVSWPWLDATHVLGADIAVLSPVDGQPVGTHHGVAVALALDAQDRLVPFHGGLFDTLPSEEVLADGASPNSLLRASSLEAWELVVPGP